MPNFISEDQIEQALVQKLQLVHGFDALECFTSDPADLNDNSGRNDKREVILLDRVRQAAEKLNPGLPAKAIDEALEILTQRRHAMTLVAANQEVYALIRDGIPVKFDDTQGKPQQEKVKLISFSDPAANEYVAVTQLWIQGSKGWRRPDVLLYVNGLPLVFIELKNSNVALRTAYDDNLTNYRGEIPQLFHTNVFCVLSNGLETRVGSLTADWEHFFPWLRVDDEKEKINRETIREKSESVPRVIEGLLRPERLLDYTENFVLYHRGKNKIVAQNHQFIGVNRAYERFLRRKELEGKLGVFWHTQGSGKSFSMIFYARKILRQANHFTFVIVTDRDDLDRQIYTNFLDTGTVTKADAAQPKNSEQLRDMLGQHKKLVFTLIHKFRWEQGGKYPSLSDRDDIIVIVDEAHRTQYKSLAENMRAGLKKAGYVAFTGTPLLGKGNKTEQWFGEYVSEYNFVQSMDDGATVPLFYQKKVPEMRNQNQELSDEFYELLEEAELNDLQKAKLEKEYATELQVIRRPDRLDAIAEDIVKHFPNRGYLGKGVVISLDKFTAVRMFDRVERLWKEEIKRLTGEVSKSEGAHKANLKKRLDWMRRVEMAVVVSEEAEEEKKFTEEGLDIARHRKRMNLFDKHGHDIEHNFKDPEHPLQLVFVCAMWLTGFDAPTVSTLYLDKPQKDHTLMQTIARANRVTSWKINGVEKKNGEVVDYYGVFRNMEKALKDYAQGASEKRPVEDKSGLMKLLEDAIAQAVLFCRPKGVLIEGLLESDDIFKNLEDFERHANTLISKDEWRKGFAVHESTITGLYEACKPEVLGQPVVRKVAVFQYLRGIIDTIIHQQDLDEVSKKISELLDASLVVDEKYKVASPDAPGKFSIHRGKVWDLSKLDFDKLKAKFKTATYKNIEIADLRAFLEKKLEEMLRQNTTRRDFAQRLQEIINRYNAGGSATQNYFDELVKFTQEMQAEDERHIREDLTVDELEIFDLLKKDKLTKDEEQRVKLAAKALLERIQRPMPRLFVQDWDKDTQSKIQVRSTVEQVLNETLPESYDRAVFTEKCNRVFDLMLDYASQKRKWAA